MSTSNSQIRLRAQSLLFHTESEPIFRGMREGEPIPVNPSISGYMYFQPGGISQPLAQLWADILHDRLYIRTVPEQPYLGVFELGNVRIKLLKEAKIEEQTCWGIRFIKGTSFERVYGPPKLISDLYDYLRIECIQSRFTESYHLGSQIGKGNFATVFIGSRYSDGKEFAVKVFEKALLAKENFEKECVLYEIKMMKTIRNPGILSLEEIFEGQNRVYCCSQLLTGGQLAEYLQPAGTTLEEDRIWKLSCRLLEALAYLESKRIIHRDLKADNVVLTSPDEFESPVIVDLGFATHINDQKKLFTRCGTPGNVAPEVLQDKPYDSRADVYSLGVLLFTAAAGKNPFESATYDDMIARNIKGFVDTAPLRTKLSDSLVHLITDMLNPNPQDRPFASELVSSLKNTQRLPTSKQSAGKLDYLSK